MDLKINVKGSSRLALLAITVAATKSFCPIVADKQGTLVGISSNEPQYNQCKHKAFTEVTRCPVITDFKAEVLNYMSQCATLCQC